MIVLPFLQAVRNNAAAQAAFAVHDGYRTALSYFTPQHCRAAADLLLAAALSSPTASPADLTYLSAAASDYEIGGGDTEDAATLRAWLPPFVVHRLLAKAAIERGAVASHALRVLAAAADDPVLLCTSFVQPLTSEGEFETGLANAAGLGAGSALLPLPAAVPSAAALSARLHPLHGLLDKAVSDAGWRKAAGPGQMAAVARIVKRFACDDLGRCHLALAHPCGRQPLRLLLLLHSAVQHAGPAAANTPNLRLSKPASSGAGSSAAAGAAGLSPPPPAAGPTCCAAATAILRAAARLVRGSPALVHAEAFDRRSNKAGALKVAATPLLGDLLALVRAEAEHCPARTAPELDDRGRVSGYRQQRYAPADCSGSQGERHTPVMI